MNTRSTTLISLVGIALAATAACGGGSTTPTPATLGQKLGCLAEPHQVSGQAELFTREDATCWFLMDDQSSQEATIYTFATADAQANWTKMAAQFGGIRVDGHQWVVAVDNQVAGATAQKRLGGKLR